MTLTADQLHTLKTQSAAARRAERRLIKSAQSIFTVGMPVRWSATGQSVRSGRVAKLFDANDLGTILCTDDQTGKMHRVHLSSIIRAADIAATKKGDNNAI